MGDRGRGDICDVGGDNEYDAGGESGYGDEDGSCISDCGVGAGGGGNDRSIGDGDIFGGGDAGGGGVGESDIGGGVGGGWW